jgi:hypothetical protein
MTPAEPEKKLDRLVAYTKQLVEEHNALEKKVEDLEMLVRGLEMQIPKAFAAEEDNG